MTRQFVVQLENRPGAMARLARALGARGVNIRHLAGGAAGDHAYAVLMTDDDASAGEVMHSGGYHFVEGSSLVLEIPDRPGELAHVAERLADAGVGILGILMLGRKDGFTEVAIAVDDVPHARAVLDLD